ncbi:NAD-dependent protein deacetylase [Spirochaetia bacterium]|nr:NAD-dependent protein deacetylase [Spirochaetia bacterium]
MDTVKNLFGMIKSASHCVALTGAGVSTLSGIRDFRGKNGLYTDKSGIYERMFDIDNFEKDPSIYYNAARGFIYSLDAKDASVVHNTLGKLEAKGFLKAVITQNIDLLHQKGGSRKVIEVHGSPVVHYCLRCAGVRMPFEEVAEIVNSGGMPKCPHCASILKPAITFFGEALPIDAIREAGSEAGKADLMLVLGTSLTVHPAAGLPDATIRSGGKIVIVNDQNTHLDRYSAMRFSDLGAVFEELNNLLDQN